MRSHTAIGGSEPKANDILTLLQAVNYLQIDRQGIHKMFLRGELDYVFDGDSIAVRRVDLEDWVRNSGTPGLSGKKKMPLHRGPIGERPVRTALLVTTVSIPLAIGDEQWQQRS